MARTTFRNMNKSEREQFWLNLFHKYQTYPGTLNEFLKEHDVSSSAFARWSKKFNEQRMARLPEDPDNHNNETAFSVVSAVDALVQQTIDNLDDSDLEDTETDLLTQKLHELSSQDNPILAAIELVMPDGFKIRLANHADVTMAIRLVQGIVNHD